MPVAPSGSGRTWLLSEWVSSTELVPCGRPWACVTMTRFDGIGVSVSTHYARRLGPSCRHMRGPKSSACSIASSWCARRSLNWSRSAMRCSVSACRAPPCRCVRRSCADSPAKLIQPTARRSTPTRGSPRNPAATATRSVSKATAEFVTYIRNNIGSIPNYGECWRNGEVISTSFVESTVNVLISKRLCKKQQMQWMPQGAHLRVQTRAQTLDGTLRGRFENRYPGLAANDPEISSTTTATAAAAVGRGGSDAPRFFMLSLPYIPHSAPPNCVCLIPRRGDTIAHPIRE